ncbi:hypothetical protein EDB89DRAFT_739890 [Lactarius sanguifluus]|nr:hypothetical protein EDB89DRAFT_739890 [Lactarius sanguifluus]
MVLLPLSHCGHVVISPHVLIQCGPTFLLYRASPKINLDESSMRPELDNVLQVQCLILNGYSVFSLINDIIVHGRNLEDQRIKLLREGVERDAADICAHLLNHNSSSVSVFLRALSVAQSMRLSEVEFENHRHGVTINMLPDDVLLEIFDFCLRDPTKFPLQTQWQRLVRVCQRW